jgi:BASS family bile acid:Na+ symporter
MKKAAALVTQLFVVWVLLAAATSYVLPVGFAWFKPFINPGLGIIMFGMGVTLTPADFKRVAEKPNAVAIGTLAQFLVMPLVAWTLAKVMALPPALAAGLILVGSCPGGTASNVMTYLARGDVALSVTLTSVSTVCSVIATPYLMQWLGGQYVPVDAPALLRSILMVIIVPVGAGLGARRFLGRHVAEVVHWMPVVSVVFIMLIVACVVALSHDRIASSGAVTFVAVVLHNGLGLALGYGLARVARLDTIRCRTIAIEVGMQNSGLGVALAAEHFGAAVALPAAIFSVWHNITGPAVAGWWSRRPVE